eukprot:611291_1
MGTSLCFIVYLIYGSFKPIVSQPAYLYDGETDVAITGQTNWTLKYPLGVLCEHPSWVKKLTIDILTTTPDQADLVMAFGTNNRYLAICIPYDSKGVVIKNTDGSGNYLTVGALVTPPPGGGLQACTEGSLESQYYIDRNMSGTGVGAGISDIRNWRYTLVPNLDVTQWRGLVEERYSAITMNVSPLVLTIWGDRATGQTQLQVEKNGKKVTVTWTDTWSIREEAFFFLGLDYASAKGELFNVFSIRSEDTCTEQTIPTAPTTPMPTISPTVKPTNYPTNPPTLRPSAVPTQSTTTMNPTQFPSKKPTEQPTLRPTLHPSMNPNTMAPITAVGVPSISPSFVSVQETTWSGNTLVDEEVNGSARGTETDADGKKEGELFGGAVKMTWIWIGAAVVICCCCLCLAAAFVIRKKRMKGLEEIADDDMDAW